MWLIHLLKKSFFFQDILSWLWTHIPPVLEHNLGKYNALKRAFYLTALEQLDGDYIEFGVFTGSSFVCALRAHRALRFLGHVETRFYGFDSFSGFGSVSIDDTHPFYQDSTFSVDGARIVQHIHKRAGKYKTRLVRGYFEDTLQGKDAADEGIVKARIILIDCDMKEPARMALRYVKDALQQGTILIMDDFFSYKGDETKGVAGAFAEFSQAYPDIVWRRLFDYGYGGVAFIVSSKEKK